MKMVAVMLIKLKTDLLRLKIIEVIKRIICNNLYKHCKNYNTVIFINIL